MLFTSSLRKMMWLSVALSPVALAGCGGGASPDPDSSGSATISSALSSADFFDSEQNRYYDVFVCDTRRSGTATVEMLSDAVDSYLLVYRRKSNGDFSLIDQNDDANNAGDARVDFDVDRGGSYRIIATSATAGERGEYVLRLSSKLGRPAFVLPDARTAQSVKLPPMPAKAAPNLKKPAPTK